MTILWGTGVGASDPAAPAPGNAGLYQVAIQIPTTLSGGGYPIVASVSGVPWSSTTMITIQPW